MKDFLSMKLIAIALPFVLGPLAFMLAQQIKRGFAWLDEQGATVKRVLVVVISAALVAASQTLGVTLPSECVAAGTVIVDQPCQDVLSTPAFVKVFLTALAAMFLHKLKKAHPKS